MSKQSKQSQQQEKKGLVPQLRFPEFRKRGEWESESIQKLIDSEYIIGHLDGNHGALYPRAEEFSSEGIPYISANDFVDGVVDFKKCKHLPIKRAKQFKKGIAKNGDVLFAHNATVGPVAKLVTNLRFVILSTTATYFRCDDDKLLSSFLLFSISSPYFVQQYSRVMSQSTRNQIPITAQRKFYLQLPPNRDEQQKIADCLSALDDLISAQSQKAEALKAHKKGLMQQLFPAAGETVPKLRFAEFRESGEWEENLFGNLGEFTGGGTPSKSKDSFWKGTIPWISSSDICDESVKKINIGRYISQEAVDNSATKLVPKNSILLVSRVGVGKLAFTSNALCTSQDFTNFTPHKDDLVFLTYYLKSQSMRLLAFSQGMAIQGFTKNDVAKLSLYLPPSNEQQKIAHCLSSLDELISAQSQKVETLKAHKKGLMQQLFPAVDG